MISGPTIPRTRVGIRNLVRERVELVEPGLTVLCEDLQLDGHDVELLARDTAGRAALILTALQEDPAALMTRVWNARSWFARHGSALLATLEEQGAEATASAEEPRLLVVGVDLLAEALTELQQLQLSGLEVYQFCSFQVGGRLHLRCQPLHLPAENPAQHPLADVADVPAGVPDGHLRDLASEFIDLLRRADARIEVAGDRFRRTFSVVGKRVCELHYCEDRLFAQLPDGELQPLDMRDDIWAFGDQVLRRLLSFEGRPIAPESAFSGSSESTAFTASSAMPHSPVMQSPLQAPPMQAPLVESGPVEEANLPNGTDAAAPPGRLPLLQPAMRPVESPPASGRFSLEPIRRRIDRSQLSAAELAAFDDDADVS